LKVFNEKGQEREGEKEGGKREGEREMMHCQGVHGDALFL
jgi:hypothetical protein